jgi:hypothetical protein
MGFSYSSFGLCCDFCGNSKPEYNVRKIACPYGWCQSWACCKNCKAKKLHLKSSSGGTTHKDTCKKSSIEYNKKDHERILLENSDQWVRYAAIGHGDKVKVLFKSIGTKEIAYWMHYKTYHTYPLGHDATLEDFKKFGKVEPCLNTNLNDSEEIEA